MRFLIPVVVLLQTCCCFVQGSLIPLQASPVVESTALNYGRNEDGGMVLTQARGGGGNKYQSSKVLVDAEIKLRPRESYHFARKTFHFSTIMAFAITYSASLPRSEFVRGMIALDFCVIAAELIRLRVPAVNNTARRFFGAVMRVHELKKFSGIMYCLAGLGIASALFPKHIALLGMLQLALGDPLAALCGHATRSVRWSRMPSGKGILGTLGAAVGLTAANILTLSRGTFEVAPSPLQLVSAAILIGSWAALVEVCVPSPQKTLPYDSFPLALDDNAVLPVLSALGAAGIFHMLGLGECQLGSWVLW